MSADALSTDAAVGVTVLMPMRNPGAFIGEAIQSILDQSYRDIELIVIDDGSTDGSREYVNRMKDARIRVVDGPRQGISACLNHGLDAARGAVVMRCDSDDIYPPARISEQVEWLRSHPDFVAVCGPFKMIDPKGELIASPFTEWTGELLDADVRILDGRLRTHFCTVAFRTEILTRIGSFRTFFQTAEDIDFMLRLASAGRMGFVPRNAYLYRLHDSSITHVQKSALRQFFEETAYAMGRERAACGTDALLRGEIPRLPVVSAKTDERDDAGKHIAQLLIGEAWQAFARGQRTVARLTAWRAVQARPGYLDAWKSLLLVTIKQLPRDTHQ